MKKMILVLMVVIALGMIGEGLYTAIAELDTNVQTTTAYTLADAYSYELPAFAIEPCTNCAMF
jgi:cell division protein FtsL